MKTKETMNDLPLMAGQIGLTVEGLGWAAVLANHGIEMLCTDPDEEVVNGAIDEVMPGEMPGLADAVQKGMTSGNLQLLGNSRRIFKDCRIIFINSILPKGDDDLPQLRFIETLVRQAANQVSEDTVLVIRSLLPAGDIAVLQEKANEITRNRDEKVEVQICVMPDYRVAGDWLKNVAKTQILTVGCEKEIPENLQAILLALPSAKGRINICTIEEAVLSAYGYNGLAALRQTYLEEITRLCLKNGASPQKVLSIIENLPDVDNAYDNMGAGYGGTLLAHRMDHLVALGKKEGAPQSLCTKAVETRDRNTLELIARLKKALKPAGKTIAVMGLAANADTDDLRNTPALDVVQALIHDGAEIKLYMTCGMNQAKWRFYKERENMIFCEGMAEATKGVDVVLILGKWKGMQRLLSKGLVKRMKGDCIFDIVGALDAKKVAALGLNYFN